MSRQTILNILSHKPFDNIMFGKLVPASRVLVLAPHCDDEILGCGGVLLEYIKRNVEIVILFITMDRSGKRKKEANAVWNTYDNVQLKFLNITDSNVINEKKKCVDMIVETLVMLNPDIIFVPWLLDMHKDHQACAIWLSHAMAILKHKGMNRMLVCQYEVNCPVNVNYSVNITRNMSLKLQLINSYVSQKPERLQKLIERLNSYRAAQFGLKSIEYVEAFFACRAHQYIELVEVFTQL